MTIDSFEAVFYTCIFLLPGFIIKSVMTHWFRLLNITIQSIFSLVYCIALLIVQFGVGRIYCSIKFLKNIPQFIGFRYLQ